MKFFISDTHFYHANVIKYSNRPYKTVGEMNQDLIDGWNDVVRKGDLVYHLGDFALTDKPELLDNVLSALNGSIIFIRGNHDKWLKKLNKLKSRKKIVSVHDYLETEIRCGQDEMKVSLMHYPMHSWNKSHHGTGQLHGHVHGHLDDVNKFIRRMDVGVDSKDGQYTPIPEDYIFTQFISPERKYNHHHGD